MIDISQLRNLYEAEPFTPFEIFLQDGRRILIERPELVGWSSDARVLSFAVGSDAIDWVNFARVADIRPVAAKRSRRRKGTSQ